MARPRLARRGSALERRLGAILRDRELWEQALTHRSYAYERGGLPTNERLEFLGDAVLGIVVTDQLYKEFPNQPEGDLAKMRAALVNMTVLADVGREIGLGDAVKLGRGEELTGGKDKSSILPCPNTAFRSRDPITRSDSKPSCHCRGSRTAAGQAARRKKRSKPPRALQSNACAAARSRSRSRQNKRRCSRARAPRSRSHPPRPRA